MDVCKNDKEKITLINNENIFKIDKDNTNLEE